MTKSSEQRRKILVVDDDEVNVALLKKSLLDEGYNVLASTEAAEGLQMAMDEFPDIIVLDVMMPIINGYNFCKLLKSQESYKSIPVIFLTSRDLDEDKEIGKEMGAEAYLTKPVVMVDLIRAIKELLKENPKQGV